MAMRWCAQARRSTSRLCWSKAQAQPSVPTPRCIDGRFRTAGGSMSNEVATDHRPPPRRRRAAGRPARPARRLRQVGHRHRAPPGGHGARRLDHRPRTRRRPRRRPDRLRGHTRRPRRRPLHAHRRAPRGLRRHLTEALADTASTVQVSLIACRPPCASPMIAAMATTRRADMFTADGKPSDDDPRENGPTLGDERTTLVEALRCQRLTLEMKCSGLDAEAMARRSVEPSTVSLLGLVRHLAEIERGTFREMMAGQDVPRLFCSDTDRDGDFDGAVPEPRVVAEAWDAWRAEVDFATRFVAEAPSLDITGDDPLNQHGSGGGPMSLREVLVGTIQEYARHMGHVDLLRERIDGRLGQ